MGDESSNRKDEGVKIAVGRGPAYPSISLREAVSRVMQIKDANAARTALDADTLFKIWGYKGASGASRPVLSSVGYYGLLEPVGRGPQRRLKLSDLALKIVFDKLPDSPERLDAIKTAALEPTVHARLMNEFSVPLPADVVIERFLVRDCEFGESAAKAIIGVYKDTLEYAGLDKPATVSTVDEGGLGDDLPLPEVEVGDLVQIEIGGAFQLEKPKRVRAIQEYEGQKWTFIEGTEAGFPMEQVIIEQKGGLPQQAVAPRLPEQKAEPKPGMKEEKNSLDEGEAVLIWPENLSAESVHDLEYWLEGILRKAKRRAGIPLEKKSATEQSH